MNEGGETWVLSATDGKILSRVNLGTEQGTRSHASITVSHGQVFARTGDTLYCFAKK